MFPPMRAARTKICLKIGLIPAFCSALFPMVVALFHLMPAMMLPAMMPGMAVPLAPVAHHISARHEHHNQAAVEMASADLASVATVGDDCHAAGEPCDDPPRTMGMHCPFCLWLQGFHALPAPVAPALRLPSARVVVVQHYEAPITRHVSQSTSQPRAPPISFLI